MLRALREQNRIIAGGNKADAEKVIKKYKGNIEWENKDRGIGWVPDEVRKKVMYELLDYGIKTSETGFSSGFYVHLK